MDQLNTPSCEIAIRTDEEGVGPFVHESCESRIDLAAGAGVKDLDLHPHGAGSRFDISQRGLGKGPAGLTSAVTRVTPGNSSRRSSSHFAANSPMKELAPVRLPPGRARL